MLGKLRGSQVSKGGRKQEAEAERDRDRNGEGHSGDWPLLALGSLSWNYWQCQIAEEDRQSQWAAEGPQLGTGQSCSCCSLWESSSASLSSPPLLTMGWDQSSLRLSSFHMVCFSCPATFQIWVWLEQRVTHHWNLSCYSQLHGVVTGEPGGARILGPWSPKDPHLRKPQG
jgi:hypothetical protein